VTFFSAWVSGASTESSEETKRVDGGVVPSSATFQRLALNGEALDEIYPRDGSSTVLDIDLEVVTAAPQSAAVRMTVAAIKRQAKGAFFVVQINRRDGDVFTAPPGDTVVGEGDGVVLIGRANRADILTSLFEPRQRVGARVWRRALSQPRWGVRW